MNAETGVKRKGEEDKERPTKKRCLQATQAKLSFDFFPTEIQEKILFLVSEEHEIRVPLLFVCRTWREILNRRTNIEKREEQERTRHCLISFCRLGSVNLVRWLKSTVGSEWESREKDERWDEVTKLATVASVKGRSFKILKKCLFKGGLYLSNDKAMAVAAKLGEQKMLFWMIEKESIVDKQRLLTAAAGGNQKKMVVKLLKVYDDIPLSSGLNKAARKGHKRMIKLLRLRGCPWGSVAKAASNGGHLELMKWLKKQKAPYTYDDVVVAAARHGHVHILEWLYKGGETEFDEDVSFHGCDRGQIRVLMWVAQQGLPWHGDCMRLAAGFNDNAIAMEMLCFLVEQSKVSRQHDDKICQTLLEAKNFGAFLWAIDAGFPVNEEVVASATVEGELDCLKKLKEKNVGWVENDVVALAVKNGHLQVLQWLFESSGATPNESLALKAAEKGHLHILQWLDGIGNMYVRAQQLPIASAASQHFHILKWMLDQGYDRWDVHDWVRLKVQIDGNSGKKFNYKRFVLNAVKWSIQNGCCSHVLTAGTCNKKNCSNSNTEKNK